MEKLTLKQAREKITELEGMLIHGEKNFYNLKDEMKLIRHNRDYYEKAQKNSDRINTTCVIQNLILVAGFASLVMFNI